MSMQDTLDKIKEYRETLKHLLMLVEANKVFMQTLSHELDDETIKKDYPKKYENIELRISKSRTITIIYIQGRDELSIPGTIDELGSGSTPSNRITLDNLISIVCNLEPMLNDILRLVLKERNDYANSLLQKIKAQAVVDII